LDQIFHRGIIYYSDDGTCECECNDIVNIEEEYDEKKLAENPTEYRNAMILKEDPFNPNNQFIRGEFYEVFRISSSLSLSDSIIASIMVRYWLYECMIGISTCGHGKVSSIGSSFGVRKTSQ
jgi:hypothetical protein